MPAGQELGVAHVRGPLPARGAHHPVVLAAREGETQRQHAGRDDDRGGAGDEARPPACGYRYGLAHD